MSSQSDHELIQILLQKGSRSVAELETQLNVTATAVRQRLNRLMAAGLVNRETESEGRGRPNHRYRLTKQGKKSTGNNLADFADALWQEVNLIADDELRRSILQGVARRLANTYNDLVEGNSIEERLNSVAQIFIDREIPVSVEPNESGLPTLKILACPYPDLDNENHEVCEMERQLFAKVTGGSFELCQCQHHGDQCCSFQTVNEAK